MNPVSTVSGRNRPRRHRAGRTLAVATAAGALGAACLASGPAHGSSHREAPLIAGDPKVDNTDLYAFVSPDAADSVTLVADVVPFQEPNGGPNFYPFADGARYDVNIDNDGDAKAEIIYRWEFTSHDRRAGDTFLYNNGPVTSLKDENLLFTQTYTLKKLQNGRATVVAKGTAAPSDVGPASMPDYAALRKAAVTKVKGGGKVFAGQADDPFFADLRVFDLLYGGDLSETGTDTLAGYNVNSLVLQVPKSEVALKADATRNPVVGVWSSTSKQSLKLGGGKAVPVGKFAQVSRLGNPLVNEVVLPANLKDAFNSLKPVKDATIPEVVARVTEPELPTLIEGIYKIPAPETPRNDLVEIFLTGIAKEAPTLDGSEAPIQADLNSQILNQDVHANAFVPSEMLRLNLGVEPSAEPNRLGVLGGDLQGFPNGRRLTDDAIDISLQAVEGAAASGELVEALAAGDKVDANDKEFEAAFPYVGLPHEISVNSSGSSGSAGPASGASAKLNATLTSSASSQGPGGGLIGAGVLALLAGGGALMFRQRRRSGESGRL